MNLNFLNIKAGKNIVKACISGVLVFLAVTPRVSAQERITPLYQNGNLHEMNQPGHKVTNQHYKSAKILELPFFDDFSTYTGYPNDTLWMDNYVYINTGFPVNPPSTGVATFDGLNSYGKAYNPGVLSNGSSDTLTSTFINLAGLKAKDSLYLSFFYQPQGNGENPDEGDSLILEFKPDSMAVDSQGTKVWNKKAWIEVWAAPGAGVYPFKEAIVPLKAYKDSNFFHGKFQFRFRSFANNSGNLDIWNVDYVLLDKGRRKKETSFKDVSVYKPSKSLIKNYNAIPWKHYIADTTNYYTDKIHVYAHNNDSVIKHVTFNYNIFSLSDNLNLANGISQANNVDPFEFQDFSMAADHFKKFTPKNPDSVVIRVKTIAKGDVAENVYFRQNDTASHIQNFNTYFAYDDGTAETGYGVSDAPNGSMVAVKFNTKLNDTLYGIGIHFNESKADVTFNYVNLMAWSSINSANTKGVKDAAIAQLKNIYPKYVVHQNGFYYFPLDTPKAVGTTFYIGWAQTSDFFFNVGFDMNYPDIANGNFSNLFYNVNGVWTQSKQHGIPMIRAFVGKKPVFAPTDTNLFPLGIQNTFPGDRFNADIYPNPNKGSFTLSLPERGDFSFEILDLNGKVIDAQKNLRGLVAIQALQCPQGIYIMHIRSNADGNQVYRKMVIY